MCEKNFFRPHFFGFLARPPLHQGVERGYVTVTSNFVITITSLGFSKSTGVFSYPPLPPQVDMLFCGSLLPNLRNHAFGGKNQ